MSKLPSSNLADQALLDKIDKLFDCGVGELVDLPQLVVVGDQSSGKSSVLEGLTRLPFPRDKELCTRFATQITFRRSPIEGISASIIPSPNSSDEHKAHVKAWSRPNLKDLSPKDFAKIILEVQSHMGIRADGGDFDSLFGDVARNFSEDVFKIEIFGPKQEHLSIVDVPGIFRNVEAGKTSKQDLDMVTRMVRGHMSNPRSVMLTVVPANVDTATQEILSMAKEYDEDGARTLGVLTKPDLVDAGAEDSVMELANGLRYPLKLGWQLLRNPGQASLNDPKYDRDAAERRFFSENSPWSLLPAEKVGVASLRKRLQDILTRHTRNVFPKVRHEMTERLKLARQKLEALGAQRSSPYEQRAYLSDLAIKFERATTEALHKHYSTDLFERHKVLRLPTRLITRQEVFASNMQLSGHEYSFNVKEETVPELGDTSDPETDVDIAGRLLVRTLPSSGNLFDCTVDSSEYVRKYAMPRIISWIQEQHSSSRGFELGSIDPNLLTTVFRGQSSKWDLIALGYVSDAIEMVHDFITTLLDTICHDEIVRESLLSKLDDQLLARYQVAFDHVKFLLKVERESTPLTANHYFSDNLQKARTDRIQQAAEKLSIRMKVGETEVREVVNISDLGKIDSMSNREHVIRDFHDVLRSYYKVALKRFVDSVSQQAAVYYLVDGPDSPLKLFSAHYVSRLSDIELEDIAGEDGLLKEKRQALIREVEKLEEGRKIV